MGYSISKENFNEFLAEFSKQYKIYAPKRYENRGRFSDTDMIRYGEIKSIEEIEFNEKSNFSPKEIIFPITQTILYFTEEQWKESTVHEKGIIVFLRPCDINGIDRLDGIFLQNGPFEDIYYKRLREKVKFVMIECSESYENCFCVSMGSNFTENYSMAVRFGDEIKVDVKDVCFEEFIKTRAEQAEFKPEYVTVNDKNVKLPEVDKMPQEIYEHKMWDEYSRRCIACGRCNTMCVTCSCFTTTDITYEDNPKAGERRRVWAGCHIDKFTNMAGGHSFRKKNGQRMRFKSFHKIYDYKKRFGKHMCVGCGRCDDNCPEYISFSESINKLTKTLKEEFSNE